MKKSAEEFSIRMAAAQDAAALARHRADLFRELDGKPSKAAPGFESACRAAFQACFSTKSCVAWIAEAPQEPNPVGNLVLLKFPRLPTPKNTATVEGYVLNVFVAPAWRKRGIASALVAAAIGFSKKSGLARIRLHTTAAGRAVYADLGFVGKDNEMELDLA